MSETGSGRSRPTPTYNAPFHVWVKSIEKELPHCDIPELRELIEALLPKVAPTVYEVDTGRHLSNSEPENLEKAKVLVEAGLAILPYTYIEKKSVSQSCVRTMEFLHGLLRELSQTVPVGVLFHHSLRAKLLAAQDTLYCDTRTLGDSRGAVRNATRNSLFDLACYVERYKTLDSPESLKAQLLEVKANKLIESHSVFRSYYGNKDTEHAIRRSMLELGDDLMRNFVLPLLPAESPLTARILSDIENEAAMDYD